MEENRRKLEDRRKTNQPVKKERRVSARRKYEVMQQKNREFAGWLLDQATDCQGVCTISQR